MSPNCSTVQTIPANGRDGSIQVLADGTQDLAALVGLFATDGVERHAVDYTRGFLLPVATPLSLLGLLGYVRALLKLGLGVEFCERTGFSTIPLRPFVGVRPYDTAYSERVVGTQYLERTVNEESISWRVVKRVLHTPESMPLTAGKGVRAMRDRRNQDLPYGIGMCTLDRSWGQRISALALASTGLTLTASIAGLPVLLSQADWTWSRFFASAGLIMSILLGGLPWCFICITEHLPFESSDWFRSDWKGGTVREKGRPDSSGQSLQRKNTLAYFAYEDQFYIFDCRATGKLSMRVAQSLSLLAAVSLTVSYICQYIELRVATSEACGIWLGVQGILAAIRIAIWHWSPNIPGFGRGDFTETELRWTDHRDHSFRDSLTELELVLCYASILRADSWPPNDNRREIQAQPQTFCLPLWLAIKTDDIRLSEALELGNRLRLNKGHDDECFSMLLNVSHYWDMPDYVFARWLQLRCRSYNHEVRFTANQRHMGIGTWVCRIVQGMDGRMHMVPGVSILVYTGRQANVEIFYFTHNEDPSSNTVCFPGFARIPGMQCLYRNHAELPNDYRSMPAIAAQAQESSYQAVLDELWRDLLSALSVLGLADRELTVGEPKGYTAPH
ncbi:MAG: hypothetical protein LQ338_001846 [Usnochroma carphineum]|nr:MAG: hypothetical protein LQ338_001846 [Usnochroma carphineum]